MIDYRTHVAALAHFRQSLASSAFADARDMAARDAQMDTVTRVPGMALLGSVIDHLMWHASSSGAELALVERAADLWKEGLTLYSAVGTFRTDLENALADPGNPVALAKFNTAAADLHPLLLDVKSKSRQIRALKQDVHKFAYLRPHPRQSDEPLPEWTWDNIFLARRTDAFARAVAKGASDEATSAFAFGVLSSYGANVCGSAYLGQVVGGPRRAHRHRDRVARNTVGSWFALQPGTPSLTAMASQIRKGAPTLPPAIETLITASLGATYDQSLVPPVPDLQLGYRRLLRHLELLDTFVLPPAPAPPTEPFLTRLYADPTNTHVSAVPQLVGVPQASATGAGSGTSVVPQSTQPTGDGLGEGDPPDSTTVECGAFWEAVGLSLLFIAGGWFYCVVNWADKKRCKLTDDIANNFNDAFPDGVYVGAEGTHSVGQGLTSAGIDNASQVDQVTTMIGHLFDMQTLMWEALQKASSFLAVHGLIYPDGSLDRPRYRQFVHVPALPPAGWPRLSEPDQNRLHRYPSTGVEHAAHTPAYPPRSEPDVFIGGQQFFGVAANHLPTATTVSGRLWRQLARDVTDGDNHDLDADRGLLHACWDARGSIGDNPIDVVILDYSAT